MTNFTTLISIVLMLILPSGQKQDDELQLIIERLTEDPYLPIDNEKVQLPGLLIDLYQFSQFDIIWKNTDQIDRMIALLGRAGDHGLLPDDYHYDYLVKNYEERDDDQTFSIYFDLLLSDAAFLYSHHIQNGKIDRSLGGTWNVPARKNYLNYIEIFYGYVITGSMPEKLEDMAPQFDLYKKLVREKKELGQLLADYGEFTWIPDTETLRLGDTSVFVPEISRRINLLGYASKVTDGQIFDKDLEQGVKKFQSHHGLEVDGIIGKSSFDMLNRTISQRQDLIDINLERLRWIRGVESRDLLVVNIAGFHLYSFKGNDLDWDTDVMTGAIDTQTPVFVSDMKYIVFNPTWTVPRSIIVKSMFQRMKNDPTYLSRNHYYLTDRGGQKVNEEALDWPNITVDKFNYSVVQEPGPWNALGRVKFIFPNQYAIYLHDTPSKSLFSKASRAFSHGCIRVKDPLILAENILREKEGYDMDRIHEILQTGETTTVFLPEPLTVALVYLTAAANSEGELTFHPDIYERDELGLSLIKAPIQ